MSNYSNAHLDQFEGFEVDGYLLEKRIRIESLGIVYKAIHKINRNVVSCKVIPKENLIEDWDNIFKDLSNRLDGISQILIYKYPIEKKFDNRSYIFVFSPYVEGTSILQYIHENSQNVSISFINFFAEQILKMFYGMKNAKITHDHLNVENILVVFDPFSINSDIPMIKVVDFDSILNIKQKERKDDYHQFALICQQLLEIIEPADLNAQDRYFYDSFIQTFLSKKVLEDDPTVGSFVKNPKELLTILEKIPSDYQSILSENNQKLHDPFDYLRCEDIGNSFELLQLLYSEKFPGYSSLLSKNNTVLTGPRGCGKTTIFRNLSLKAQILGKKIKQAVDYKENYIGIYYHCNDLYFAFPYLKEEITFKERSAIIHYFNLSIFNEILELLSSTKNIPGFEFSNDFVSELQNFYSGYNPVYQKPPTGTDIFHHLIAIVLKEKVKVRHWFENSNNPKPIFLPMDFIKNICKILQEKIPWMNGRSIYFLLDDYSSPSISIPLQESLHDFIFFPSAGSEYFFKVSTESIVTFHPCNSKKKLLEEGREYLTVDLGYFFRSDEEKSVKFIYEIVNNRLKHSDIVLPKYHNIEAILGKSSNKSNIQMARNIRVGNHELYYGHDIIMRLCSGDIALILALIKRIFESVGGAAAFNNPDLKIPIDPAKQNKVVKEMGNEFLDKIENVPDLGKQLRDITQAFGDVAHWYLVHRNSKNLNRSPPWQSYRLEIRNRTVLKSKDQEIYNGLLRYSIFIRDTRGKSQRGEVAPRLYLRKILIPTFLLTLSKRDNIGINPDDFVLLLNEPEKFKIKMEGKKQRAKKRPNLGASTKEIQSRLEHE